MKGRRLPIIVALVATSAYPGSRSSRLANSQLLKRTEPVSSQSPAARLWDTQFEVFISKGEAEAHELAGAVGSERTQILDAQGRVIHQRVKADEQ